MTDRSIIIPEAFSKSGRPLEAVERGTFSVEHIAGATQVSHLGRYYQGVSGLPDRLRVFPRFNSPFDVAARALLGAATRLDAKFVFIDHTKTLALPSVDDHYSYPVLPVDPIDNMNQVIGRALLDNGIIPPYEEGRQYQSRLTSGILYDRHEAIFVGSLALVEHLSEDTLSVRAVVGLGDNEI